MGTLRTNRVRSKNVKIFYDMKDKRNYGGEMMQHQICMDCYVTSWLDKRPVNMLHSFPTFISTINRPANHGETGEHFIAKVDRPSVIDIYNKGMGGTDLFDQYLSYYRTSIKTKRWLFV